MKRYKSLVEGAMFAAIFTVMLVISAYIPPVGAIGVYFLPLPITVYAYRNSFGYSMMVLVVTIILAFMLAPPIAIINAIMASTMGAFYGTVLRKKLNPLICFLTLILISSTEFILVELFAKTAFGWPVIAPFIDGLKQLLNTAVYALSKAGIQLSSMQLIDMIISNLALGIFSVMGVLNSLIVFSITAIFFKRLGYEMVYLPSFSKSKEGKVVAGIYLITITILMTSMTLLVDHQVIAAIVVNLFLLLSVYYWIKGYLIFCEYIIRFRFSKPLTMLLCMLSFWLMGIVLIIMAVYKSLLG